MCERRCAGAHCNCPMLMDSAVWFVAPQLMRAQRRIHDLVLVQEIRALAAGASPVVAKRKIMRSARARIHAKAAVGPRSSLTTSSAASSSILEEKSWHPELRWAVDMFVCDGTCDDDGMDQG